MSTAKQQFDATVEKAKALGETLGSPVWVYDDCRGLVINLSGYGNRAFGDGFRAGMAYDDSVFEQASIWLEGAIAQLEADKKRLEECTVTRVFGQPLPTHEVPERYTTPPKDAQEAWNRVAETIANLKNFGRLASNVNVREFDTLAFRVGLSQITAAVQDLGHFALFGKIEKIPPMTLQDQADGIRELAGEGQ